MDRFMQRAVELAIENVRAGGQPFGAVLVKDHEVVGEGANELHKTYDVSGHAELLAIRRAQARLQTNDLSGCIMYASGEPCPMCLTAIYFAGIETVIYEELQKPKAERNLRMIHMPLQEGQENPMRLWREHAAQG